MRRIFVTGIGTEIGKTFCSAIMSQPMSPHAAANIDGIRMSVVGFTVPATNNHLVIEGAGGLMVPINNDGEMIADLIPAVANETILIVKHYLGSINHTLLSIESAPQD